MLQIGGSTTGSGGGFDGDYNNLTNKPSWTSTIDERVENLEENSGSSSTPATSLFGDSTHWYFVIPSSNAWVIRKYRKTDLSVTSATSASEPTTLSDVLTLEYA